MPFRRDRTTTASRPVTAAARRLARPVGAVALAMVAGGGLMAVWSRYPGRLTLPALLIVAVAVGAWAVAVIAVSLDGDAVARDEAARLHAFRHEIVTTVSHELRTPLTVVQGLTSLLTSRWDVLPETRKLDLVDSIQLNVASLDASILHFVDAGRLVRGEWHLAPEKLTLAEVLEPVTIKLAAVLAGHELQLDVSEEWVWGDGEAVGRIVELLLANAARFAPLATTITVRATRGRLGSFELSVGDQGPGIPAHQLARVWEPFWRGDVGETGVSRGAGLGLFIVKELAERHHGSVRVSSSRGRGTTVTVSFPGRPAPLAAGREQPAAGAMRSDSARVGPPSDVGRDPRRGLPTARPARPGRVRVPAARAGALRRTGSGS